MLLIEKKGKILIRIVMIFLWTTRAERIQIFYFRKFLLFKKALDCRIYLLSIDNSILFLYKKLNNVSV